MSINMLVAGGRLLSPQAASSETLPAQEKDERVDEVKLDGSQLQN